MSKIASIVTPMKLRRTKTKFIFGASVDIPSYETIKDEKLIKGLDSKLTLIPAVQAVDGSDSDGPYQEIPIPSAFPPGSVMLFTTQLEGIGHDMDSFCKEGVDAAFSGLDLTDLNVILHRCDEEEKDATGR
jgi:glycogen debranching enzyme